MVLLAATILAGCGQNLDSVMWDCQLDVQKGNAGRSPADVAERDRDINACMESRGFQLDVRKPSCHHDPTNSSCYRAR